MTISCSLADMQSGELGAEVRKALYKIVEKNKVVTKDGDDSSSTTIGSDKKSRFARKKVA